MTCHLYVSKFHGSESSVLENCDTYLDMVRLRCALTTWHCFGLEISGVENGALLPEYKGLFGSLVTTGHSSRCARWWEGPLLHGKNYKRKSAETFCSQSLVSPQEKLLNVPKTFKCRKVIQEKLFKEFWLRGDLAECQLGQKHCFLFVLFNKNICEGVPSTPLGHRDCAFLGDRLSY